MRVAGLGGGSGRGAGNPYVCAAMIRAVMDHIPLVFGQPDFRQVAAQHTFAMKKAHKAHAQVVAQVRDGARATG